MGRLKLGRNSAVESETGNCVAPCRNALRLVIALQSRNEVQCSPIPVDAMMQRCNEALHAGVQSWRREVSAAQSAPPGGSRYLRPGFSTGSCSALLLLNLN